MRMFTYLSDFMIPLILFYIIGLGLLMKRNVYEDFLSGAKSGFRTVVQILPTLVGLLTAVGVLRASGFLDLMAEWIGKISEPAGFPAILVPLTIVRLFSASAANGLAVDIFKEYGCDSLEGMMASILLACTETLFYCVTIYFGVTHVRKTRYTVPGALAATMAGAAASVILVRCFI